MSRDVTFNEKSNLVNVDMPVVSSSISPKIEPMPDHHDKVSESNSSDYPSSNTIDNPPDVDPYPVQPSPSESESECRKNKSI